MQKKGREAEKLEGAAAEDMEISADLQEDVELPIALMSGGDCGGFAIQLCDVSFAYPECKTLYSGVEFGVTSNSRIVLLGENGNGKTTLVKLMLGSLTPTKGEVKLHSGLRVALVNQHHADQVHLADTFCPAVCDAVQRLVFCAVFLCVYVLVSDSACVLSLILRVCLSLPLRVSLSLPLRVCLSLALCRQFHINSLTKF